MVPGTVFGYLFTNMHTTRIYDSLESKGCECLEITLVVFSEGKDNLDQSHQPRGVLRVRVTHRGHGSLGLTRIGIVTGDDLHAHRCFITYSVM